MSYSEEDFIPGTPPEIREQVIVATLDLLPEKSRKLYENEYDLFMHWCKKKTVTTESLLLTYLSKIGKTFKCLSLWSKFSRRCLFSGNLSSQTSFNPKYSLSHSPFSPQTHLLDTSKSFLSTPSFLFRFLSLFCYVFCFFASFKNPSS